MRLSNFIEVYKTPLDKNYRNVYDEYSTYDEYISFLRNFPTNRIYTYNQSVKSRKDANGIFNVQISGFDSMDLHDYNYILFYTGENTPHFAFITFVSSLNDGASTKACELACKLDAWSNNYFTLKTANPTAMTTRATYDNFDNRFYPNELQNRSFPVNKTFIKSLQPTEFVGTTAPRVVLWQRIFCGYAVKMYYDGASYKIYSYTDNLQNAGGLVPCYRVAGILDSTTRRLVKCTVRLNGKSIHDTTHTYITLQNYSFIDKPYFTASGVNGTYGYANTFTFTIPRIYSVVQSFSDGDEIIDINIDQNCDIDRGSIVAATGDEVEPAISDSTDWIIFPKSEGNFALSWSHTISLPRLPSTPSRYSKNITSLMQSEGLYSEYPFKYYSLIINGEEYPLIPEYSKGAYASISFTVNSYLDDRTYKSLRIIRNVDTDKSLKLIATKEEMPTRINQLDQYLAFNRNQLETKMNLTATRSLVGMGGSLMGLAVASAAYAPPLAIGVAATAALTSTASFFVNTLGEYYTQKAEKSDIANRPDIYSSTDNNSVANMYFGDDIVLVYNEVDFSSEVIRSMFTDLHHFGTSAPKSLSIFSRRRDIYDSVITPEELRVQINDADREELQTALHSGMTFWHIVPYIQSFDRTEILKTMDKQVANICYSVI